MTIFSEKLRLTAGLISLLLISACSSSSRVVYLGSGTTKMVQLRETLKGVKVWVKDSTGVAIPMAADLPEGGFYRKDLN